MGTSRRWADPGCCIRYLGSMQAATDARSCSRGASRSRHPIPRGRSQAGLLGERLRVEWPGILAWMIDGCIDWLERGLAPPQSVTDATEAYLQAEDAIAAWLDEAGDRDPNAWEKSGDLFASWVAWATKAGEYVGSQKRFTQNLETHGLQFERRSYGRGFRGLRLPAAWYGSR